MTKEELRKWLKNLKSDIGNSQHHELWHYEQAIDIVIEALSDKDINVPSNDEWCTDCKEYDHERHCCPRWNRVIRQTLKDAQERKTGRWIQNDNGTWSCDKCGSWIPDEQHYYARFCLYCGCRMMTEQSIDDKVADLPSEAYYNKNWESGDGGGA